MFAIFDKLLCKLDLHWWMSGLIEVEYMTTNLSGAYEREYYCPFCDWCYD